MRRIAALSWILSALFLTGCMTTGQGPTTASQSHNTFQSRNTPQSHNTPQAVPVSNVEAPEAGGQAVASPAVASPAVASPAPEDYQLGPLDVIEVSVFEVPELTKTLQVSSGGEISLPLIGRVVVDGKTVSEVEREIEQKLAKDYLQSPQVSVFVKEYTSQRITIEGAVNSPGVFPIAGRTTLLQAIAMAKGATRVADESGVIIFRTTDGTRTAAVFDIGPIRKGDAPDPVLIGGDMIVVDESGTRTAWRTLRESLGVMSFFRPTVF